MINVIASIKVKPDLKQEFIEAFRKIVPVVLQEEGCIEYAPNIDVDAALAPQALDVNVVTIIEKWESLDALRAHLQAPHMIAYREKTGAWVESVSLKILQPA
jgi:quinol monooxygenase YgiN